MQCQKKEGANPGHVYTCTSNGHNHKSATLILSSNYNYCNPVHFKGGCRAHRTGHYLSVRILGNPILPVYKQGLHCVIGKPHWGKIIILHNGCNLPEIFPKNLHNQTKVRWCCPESYE